MLRLARFCNLCLGKEYHVASDLAEDSDCSTERGGKLGEASAIGVPREYWFRESEAYGQAVRDVDSRALE